MLGRCHEDCNVCSVPVCPQLFCLQLATGPLCNHGILRRRNVFRAGGNSPPSDPTASLLYWTHGRNLKTEKYRAQIYFCIVVKQHWLVYICINIYYI